MRHSIAAALLLLFAAACTPAGRGPGPAPAAPGTAPILPEAKDESSFARPLEARYTHVALDLVADFEAMRFAGTATLDVEAAPGARELVLDSKGLAVRSVTDQAGRPLAFAFGEPDADKGAPLTVQIGDARRIRIDYLSAPEA